jgi:hypothetical protein
METNFGRKCESRNASKNIKYLLKIRADVLEAEKCCLSSQQDILAEVIRKKVPDVRNSFSVARISTKAGKTLTND